MLSINHNQLAANVANNLNSHYGHLATSTQRLSSGLRINGAADDAAGLAIRELMRADVGALQQGMRNVNDAISMVQTFDGALGIIDEKLIRMKELAEQAATGTYDSTQRLMIDSEFQAMGSEIDRIANATDFNGIKLLTSKLITWYTDEDRFVVTDPGSFDPTSVTTTMGNTGTLSKKGINPNKYVNQTNPQKTISISLTSAKVLVNTSGKLTDPHTVPDPNNPGGTLTTYNLKTDTGEATNFTIAQSILLGNNNGLKIAYTAGNPNPWRMSDDNHTTGVNMTAGGTMLSGTLMPPNAVTAFFQMVDANNRQVDFDNFANDYPDITSFNFDFGNQTWSKTENVLQVSPPAGTTDYTASYNEVNKTVTVRLTNGGTVTLALDNALVAGDAISFDINFEGEVKTVPVEHHGVDPNQKVKIHFGPMNDSAEDYYYINYSNCTMEGLGLGDVDIQTQDKAQNALVQINDAIVAKDKVRAEYGAMQNRLENTFTNLSTQAENLRAAESRLSDAEIATEMTNFVRNQILTQSSVAMLAQANSMPQMVARLIGA